MRKEIEYNSLFLGILIGSFLIFGIMWYMNRGQNKGDDWWCSYLAYKESGYCHSLYLKYKNNIDKTEKGDEPCTPDHIGGCN